MQIYLIANKINGKNYIGQTIWDFNTRYHGGHWEKFSHNKHLKNAAKKYGVDNFEVKILREGNFSPKELDLLEDFYIKEFNSLTPNGYNKKEAGKTGRNYYNYKEYELHDSLGTIYKIINLSQFCKKNNLNYGAMLNMVSGINTSSQGYALSSTPIDLIINPNETWELEYIPTKQIIKIQRKDIPSFCEQYNLKTDLVYKLINKKTYVTHKWKLKSTILGGRIREDTVKYKNIHLSHKDGRSVIVNNVYEFCKNNNLERCAVYKLIKKEAIEHLGWRLSSISDAKEERGKRLGNEIEIKNIETNEILKIKNISDFCRKNNLNINVMFSMIKGNIKQYFGWTIPNRDLSNYTPPKKIIYIKMIHFDGSFVETDNAKKIETEYKICTKQTIYEIIRGNAKNLIRGWKIVNVKFLKNYYPEINFL